METRRALLSRLNFRTVPQPHLSEESGLTADPDEAVTTVDASPTEPTTDLSRRRLLGLGLAAFAGAWAANAVPTPISAAYQGVIQAHEKPNEEPATVPDATALETSPQLESKTQTQPEQLPQEGNPLLIGAINATYAYAITRPPIGELATQKSHEICEALGIPEGSYGETIMQTLALAGVAGGISAVLSAFHLESGNKTYTEDEAERLLRDHFLGLLAFGTIAVPPIEEFLFRLLPSGGLDLLSKVDSNLRPDPRVFWPLGIAQATLFGLMHNRYEAPNGQTLFANSLPLQQTTLGLALWHIMREKGFSHAVLSHGTINATAFSRAKVALG